METIECFEIDTNTKLNKNVSLVIDCTGVSFYIGFSQFYHHLTWLDAFSDIFKKVEALSMEIHTESFTIGSITEEQILDFYEVDFGN